MKKLFVATISLVLLLLMSCTSNKQKPEPGIELNETEVNNDIEPINVDEICDTIFTFGNTKLEATRIVRNVETSKDVYMSLDVYAIPTAPATINYIAQQIDSMYIFVTGQEPEQIHPVKDVNELKANFTALTTNFHDSIAPDAVRGEFSISNSFYVCTSYRPVYAFDEYVTYEVSNSNYTGGAHGYYEEYCYTTDRNDGRPLSFEQLVKKDARKAVKQALVETIAKSKDMTVEEWLKDASFFINMPDGADIADFPVVYVGITDQALVFSYPPYAIGPFSDGNQTFALPIESVASSLTIKVGA